MNGLPSDAPFPPGDLRSIVFHWTAGDYRSLFASYHVCVALGESEEGPLAVLTSDLRANMRDVRHGDAAYAAHTSGRNSHAIGLALCGMENATPSDFGLYPVREDFIAVACRTAARLCRAYAIPVDRAHVYTHAEAALEDGYFGCAEDQRWDIARLTPSPGPLQPSDAPHAGDELRRRVREAMKDCPPAREVRGNVG
jgi:N-acetylmuramoyl-L-alanine amidase